MSRADKVSESLKEEISNILQREVKDPRIGFVTITAVDIKPDLRFAKVYYSVIPNVATQRSITSGSRSKTREESTFGMVSEKQIESAKAGLQSAAGFIRKLIGERIRLRYTPELAFEYDNSLVYSQRISDVLKEIEKNKLKKGDDAKKNTDKPDKKK
ncbi:MAG: 30S ribosome-binding factor RbfA [Candidatus Omnitrophota bacterium]